MSTERKRVREGARNRERERETVCCWRGDESHNHSSSQHQPALTQTHKTHEKEVKRVKKEHEKEVV